MQFKPVGILALLLLWLNGIKTQGQDSTMIPEPTTPADAKGSLYVNYTGDLILGALFPIHRRGSASETCDRIQPEEGVQPLEILLHTIDKINKNGSILPGIRLGVLALDTCDSPLHAMEQSMGFVKGYIAHYNDMHVKEYVCQDNSTPSFLRGGYDKLIGVIGGQSSSVSFKVASLLRLFHVPQVSYMSTSHLLSGYSPYFFRTVPSDVNQAHAILDILKYFNWSYAALIYSDSDYGVHCFEKLRDFAANDSICFTSPAQRIIRDQFTSDDYEQVMKNIIKRNQVRVIILILEKEYTVLLFEAARRLNVGERYVWIGTDGWSNRELVIQGRENIVEGSIAIQPLISHVKEFDNYFMNLNPATYKRNPWFKELWEEHFQCKLDGTPLTRFNTPYMNQTCSPDLRISPENGYNQQSFLHFVRDAAYVFAFALRAMQKDLCGEKFIGICDNMKHIDGPEIVKYLRNVSFKDEDDNVFRFVNGEDGPIRYTIINFQNSPNGSQWITVGNYSRKRNGEDLELTIKGAFRYRGDEPFPESTCSIPCLSHQVKVRDIKLEDFCIECPKGEIPNGNHSNCIPIQETFIEYTNPWAILAMIFATIGIVTTSFVGIVFWNFNDTPVIKAAGRELSYVLLVGILLSFLTTFIIVSEPSRFNCGLVRFFLGFCPTLCYAAICTKLNRIARIFHHNSSTPKTKYTSPRSQMIIVLILITLDVAIIITWLVIDVPEPIYIYPNRSSKLKICGGLQTYSYMVGFIYPLILIIFCTIYAVQTRKCPEGFNETKYIGFTNYTICVLWLAFVPLYLASTSNAIRVVTLAISLSLSGFVELFCLFFPKIYIVLFKPEKNKKEHVMLPPNRNSFGTLNNSASVPQHNFSHPHLQMHSNNHTIHSTGGISRGNSFKNSLNTPKKTSLVEAELSSSDGIYFKNLTTCASEPNFENMEKL